MKCHQETETSPVDYGTALKTTMTRMTENRHQQDTAVTIAE